MTTIRRKRIRASDVKRRWLALVIFMASFLSILLCIVRFLPWRGTSISSSSNLHSSGDVHGGLVSSTGRLGQHPQVANTKTRHHQSTKQTNIHQVDGLMPMRRVLEDDNFDPLVTEMARQILGASMNLVNIYKSHSFSITDESYSGIVAEFCPLNFTAQKDNPPSLPMFKDVECEPLER